VRFKSRNKSLADLGRKARNDGRPSPIIHPRLHGMTAHTFCLAVFFRPEGPAVNSQGRQPLERIEPKFSPEGATVPFFRPFGAHDHTLFFQGLTPLAINSRPFGSAEWPKTVGRSALTLEFRLTSSLESRNR
jgi:hypothetical protein